MTAPTIRAVCARRGHHFSKASLPVITLLAGLGVEGDGHAGERVQHRSRVRRDPSQPNLRQVHLIESELLEELNSPPSSGGSGFDLEAGNLGENVLTRGLDLLALPRGTHLALGEHAVIELTGLRNPCTQLDDFRPGLMSAVLERDEHGALIRKAGVMAIVSAGGEVRPGDTIEVRLPGAPHERLEPV